MMDTPGSILKAEREKQNKSLEEIAVSLKLNLDYLKAIENGTYDKIPAELYVRAYLRFYAQALGLDSGFVLGLYEKKTHDQAVQTQKPAIEKQEEQPASRKGILVIVSVLVLVVTASVWIYMMREHTKEMPDTVSVPAEAPDKPKEEQVSGTIEPSTTAEPAAPAIEPVQQPSPPPQTVPQPSPADGQPAELSLKIIATGATWIYVRTDDRDVTQKMLNSNDEISFTASEKFYIKAGDAGAVKVIFNGKEIGNPGEPGTIAELRLPAPGQ